MGRPCKRMSPLAPEATGVEGSLNNFSAKMGYAKFCWTLLAINIAFRNHLLICINPITDIGHMNQSLLSIYLPCIVIID